MFNLIKDHIRSTTGSNLGQLNICDIQQLKYHPNNGDHKWKPNVVTEMFKIRNKELAVDGFSMVELVEILFHLCSD